MPQSDPPIEPVPDVRTARAVLAALVVVWAGLAFWAVGNGERFIVGPSPGTGAAKDVASIDERTPVAPDRATAEDADQADTNLAEVDADAGPGETDAAGGAEAVPEGTADERAGDTTTVVVDGRSDVSGAATAPAAVETDDETEEANVADGSSNVGEPLVSSDARGESSDVSSGAPDEPGDVSNGIGPSRPTDRLESIAPTARPPAIVAGEPGADDADAVFESRRREEIATLETLLGERLAFEPLGSAPVARSREALERAFEILFLYPETRLELIVRSNETYDAAFDRQLARRRGQAVVDYLVSRGIERERLGASDAEGRGLPFGEHRVRVTVEDENR